MARSVIGYIVILVTLAILLLRSKMIIHYTADVGALKVTNQESTKAWCIDGLCLGYLSDAEREKFITCTYKAAGMKLDENALCHFMNGTGRQPVALVSFPGSGNTWVRGLLQKATGICTGAVYCDKTLKASFIGEGIQGASVLAVKTHKYANGTKYGSAIFIVRDLRDALISNRNRIISKDLTIGRDNHVGTVGPVYFGNNDWDSFLRTTHFNVFYWQRMMITWAEYSKTHPLLVVYYEDLKEDTVGEVQKILEFLGIPSIGKDFAQKMKEGYARFHRKKDQEFEHYTPDQKRFVNEIVADTKRTLSEKGLQDIFHLDRYLE